MEFYAETDDDAAMIFQDTALVMYDAVAEHRGSDGKPLLIFDRKRPESQRTLDFPEARSRFSIGSAEKKVSGHGHTIHKLHLSEASRYPVNKVEEFWRGVIPAVVKNGEVVVECTANGAFGKFYEIYQQAKAKPDRPWHSIAYFWYEATDDPYYFRDVHPDYARAILAQVATGQGHEYAPEERDLAQRLALQGIVLTAGQWAFRREQRDELGDGFFEQYPEDDVSCFLTTGRLYFSGKVIDFYGSHTCNPKTHPGQPILYLDGGDTWVWEEPIPGRRYCLSSDVAQGETIGDNSDFSTITICDYDTGDDVLEFMGRVPPDILATMIDKYGRRYNDAIAGPERNGSGYSVIRELKSLRYPNLWIDEKGECGVLVTEQNRIPMLDALDQAMRVGYREGKQLYCPRSFRFISQCRTFIRNKTGRPEGASGKHDDLVMCKAENYFMRCRAKDTYAYAEAF